jgi:CRISPR-associated protein Cas2
MNVRFNQYRIMWLFILFDLPTETKEQRKAHSQFRKNIMKDGFNMFQFSVYTRHCASRENAEVHIQRIKHLIPTLGNVCIMMLTDKQFGMIELYSNSRKTKSRDNPQQLSMF